jgi:hypothetical protein
MAKAALNKNSFHQQIGLNLRKKLVNCYIWSIALYRAETWTLRKVDQKYFGSFEIFSNVIMEKYGEIQLDQSCEK